MLAKLEFLEPGGSIKVRSALSMITDLERSGRISPNTTIIEASTGNQGIAVAMVSAIKGYRCIICIPELYGIERRKIMQAYGARVILTPTFEDMEKTVWVSRRTAMQFEKEIPGAHFFLAEEMIVVGGDTPHAYFGAAGESGGSGAHPCPPDAVSGSPAAQGARSVGMRVASVSSWAKMGK